MSNNITRNELSSGLATEITNLRRGVNVKDFGAIGDGVTNDSSAISLAYNSLNDGDILYFPLGKYKCNSNFPQINKKIKILGESMHNVEIHVYSQSGNAFIENKSNFIEISNLSFYYPEQVRTDLEYLANSNTVKIYPPLISGVGYYCKFTNLNIGNAYEGLKIGNTTDSSSAVVIENIIGTPLKRGFYLDRCLDIPKIKDVHFNRNIFAGTDKELESNVYSWILNNATAFAFGRVDWANIERLFEYGYKIGINIVNLGYTGSADFLTFSGCQFDNTKQPLVLNDFNSTLKFQDCIFVGDNSSSNSSIDSQATTENLVIFDTCTFDNYANKAIVVKSNSIFDKCNFTNFAKSNGVYEAIYLDNDNIYCKLNNNNFDGTSATNARALFNNDKSAVVIAKNNNFKNLLQSSLRVTSTGKLIEEDSILNGINIRNPIGFYKETHVYKSETVPVAGDYIVGDIVINTKPTELGLAGSKYIITHWYRLTTGSNNVVGTDWVEERVPMAAEYKTMTNVKDFGAIGDGITDDTVAIQNAINSITSGIVYLPAGTYKITSTINITKYIVLQGAGSKITSILRSADYIGIKIYGTKASYLSLASVGIRDIRIDASQSFTTDSVQIIYCSCGYFENLIISDSGGNGLYLRSVQDSVFKNMYIRYCGNQVSAKSALYFDTYNVGESATSNDNVNDNEFFGCTFEHNIGQLFLDIGANNNSNSWIGCKFEYTGGASDLTAISITGNPTARYIFDDCRFTSAYKMFDISNSNGIEINGKCYNNFDPTYFAQVTDSKDVRINVTGRKTGVVNFLGNTYDCEKKVQDYELAWSYNPILDLFGEKQKIDLRRIHLPNEGAIIADDGTVDTGFIIYGNTTDNAKAMRAKICSVNLRTPITFWFNLKSSSNKTYEVRLRGSTSDNILLTTLNVTTSYAWYSVSIRPELLIAGCQIQINNTTGQSGINLSIADMYYENNYYSSSAPAAGTWKVSDIAYNSEPSSAEYLGWICVSAGAPGTWKGFGLIQA